MAGKQYYNSDNFYVSNYGTNHNSVSYALPKKFANGKPWELFCTYDYASFHSVFECGFGVLANVSAGVHKVVSHSHLSTAAKVRAATRNRG